MKTNIVASLASSAGQTVRVNPLRCDTAGRGCSGANEPLLPFHVSVPPAARAFLCCVHGARSKKKKKTSSLWLSRRTDSFLSSAGMSVEPNERPHRTEPSRIAWRGGGGRVWTPLLTPPLPYRPFARRATCLSDARVSYFSSARVPVSSTVEGFFFARRKWWRRKVDDAWLRFVGTVLRKKQKKRGKGNTYWRSQLCFCAALGSPSTRRARFLTK